MVFSQMPASLSLLFPLLLSYGVSEASAYDNSRQDNVAVYYGQNSYGAGHTDSENFQKNLAFYCEDDSIDAFPVAFLNVYFGTGGQPEINLANTCNNVDDDVFPGTGLANCQFMAEDIQTCQSRGKIVTISLGGATGNAVFTDDAQAEEFAQTVWDLFLGGESDIRPFGDAVLDGVDLDIEGGSSTGYAAFVTRIRALADGASKPYYVTAAPQCPFPDAYLGAVLDAVGFDAVYVQFYNNFCSVANYDNPNAWNFAQWDDWAKNTSPNPDVKIYIGAPADATAAGSGYVDVATLGNIATETRSQYSSFGGVMLWDASQAYNNGRFDQAIKAAIAQGGSEPPETPTTTSDAPSTTSDAPTSTSSEPTSTTTSSDGGSGSCESVAAWDASTAYVGGSQVSYEGRLYTAKWWTQAETPGQADVWTDNGACAARATPASGSSSASGPEVTSTETVGEKDKRLNSRFFRF